MKAFTSADIAADAAIAASKIDTNTLNADLLDGYHASAFLLKSMPNPNQIALDRWYEAAQADTSFTVGGLPEDITFDGENIWVTSFQSNYVTKLNAATLEFGPTQNRKGKGRLTLRFTNDRKR